MKRALLLFVLVACGGGNASTAQTTTPSANASATSSAPTETATAQTEDVSPTPIGTRHKKIGNGWFLSGGGKEFYDAIYEPGAEPVIVMKRLPGANPAGRWVTLMKNVSAAPYIGKKIRVRIGVKATGVTGLGDVWARAAGPHAAEDAPSVKVKLDPSSEMKMYEVTLDVKDATRVIEYGASIAGEGELRVGRDAIDLM